MLDVHIPASRLREALLTAQGLIDRKSTLPILQNVLLQANGDELMIQAMDNQVGIQVRVPCQVNDAGSLALAPRRLIDLLKELGDELIHGEGTQENALLLTYGSGHVRLFGYGADIFPPFFEVDEGQALEVDAPALVQLITLTEHAVARHESAYNLKAALFALENRELSMVATDGHRLALARESSEDLEGSFKVLLPLKVMSQLKHLLAGREGRIAFGVNDRQAWFRTEGTLLVTRLIDDEFPPYERVLPSDEGNRMLVEGERFYALLRRVTILADPNAPAVKMAIEPNRITVRSENVELGEAEDWLGIEFTGRPLTLAINGSFVMDALAGCRDGQVEVIIESHEAPFMIRPEGSDRYAGVIMPLEVDSPSSGDEGGY